MEYPKPPVYTYITRSADVAGGAPIIEGTRITVRTIAAYHGLGMSVDDTLKSLPDLRPAHVYAALMYYYDHQLELYRDLAPASNEAYWRVIMEDAKQRQLEEG